MIAAEILLAPRSPDVAAPTAPQPTSASGETGFADLFAAELGAPADGAAPVPLSAMTNALPEGMAPTVAPLPQASADMIASLTLPTQAQATPVATPDTALPTLPVAAEPEAAAAAPAQTALPDAPAPIEAADLSPTDAVPATDLQSVTDGDATTKTDTAEDKPTVDEKPATDDTAPTDASATLTVPAQVELPPLAAMILPLTTAHTVQDPDTADTEAAPAVTVGDAPAPKARPRGMVGKLAERPDAQGTQDPTPGTDQPAAQGAKDAHETDRIAALGDRMADRRDQIDGNGATPQDPRGLTPQAMTAAQTRSADAQTPAQPPVDTARAGWENVLADRITTHATDFGQEVEITLTPDNLGTVRIKLDLSDKQAQVQIVTDTPQAAQLFQQSEARLAEAFTKAGLTLTNHDASSRDAGTQARGGQGGQGGQQGGGFGTARHDAALAGLAGAARPQSQGRAQSSLLNLIA